MSPWTIALGVAAAVAGAESIAIGLLYRDLPIDRGPFAVVYFLTYAGCAALLGGALAAGACRLRGDRPGSVGLALAAAWALILLPRGFRVLENFQVLAREQWSRAGLVMAGAAVASVGLGLIAWGLARMIRRELPFVRTLAVTLVVAGLGLCLASRRPEAPAATRGPAGGPPAQVEGALLDPTATNILLVVIDTLRADHTSPYGYRRDTSPSMGRLAERGVVFERCVTQRTNTTPSMATMMTGLYPPQTGVVDAADVLDDAHTTLGEILTRHGYDTAAFCANGMAGPRYNLDQGMARFEMIHPDEQTESRAVNEAALAWLEQERDRPFFLWMHYKDPHWPYEVPEDYADLYEAEDGHAREIAKYDAEIRFNDDSLRTLLDALDRLGHSQDTLVILTSDHGESLGEHDYYYSHGAYCYEPTAHVPLIFAHPAIEARRIASGVGLIDLLPTLLDLLGLPLDVAVKGQSLAGVIAGGESQLRRHQFVLGGGPPGYHSHAVTDDRHKLVLDVDGRWVYLDVGVSLAARLWGISADHPYRLRVVRRELYDLDADPGEMTNLADRRQSIRAELDARLWTWIDEVYEGWVPGNPYRDPEVLEELRSLGYL